MKKESKRGERGLLCRMARVFDRRQHVLLYEETRTGNPYDPIGEERHQHSGCSSKHLRQGRNRGKNTRDDHNTITPSPRRHNVPKTGV